MSTVTVMGALVACLLHSNKAISSFEDLVAAIETRLGREVDIKDIPNIWQAYQLARTKGTGTDS